MSKPPGSVVPWPAQGNGGTDEHDHGEARVGAGGGRLVAGMATEPSRRTGVASRPVAIPDDVDDPQVVKASGLVELPLNVRWSAPFPTYDLSDRKDRMRVYEQVLTEGTEDDVRRFIDVSELVRLWDDIVLSPHVGAAWRDWLERNGYL